MSVKYASEYFLDTTNDDIVGQVKRKFISYADIESMVRNFPFMMTGAEKVTRLLYDLAYNVEMRYRDLIYIMAKNYHAKYILGEAKMLTPISMCILFTSGPKLLTDTKEDNEIIDIIIQCLDDIYYQYDGELNREEVKESIINNKVVDGNKLTFAYTNIINSNIEYRTFIKELISYDIPKDYVSDTDKVYNMIDSVINGILKITDEDEQMDARIQLMNLLYVYKECNKLLKSVGSASVSVKGIIDEHEMLYTFFEVYTYLEKFKLDRKIILQIISTIWRNIPNADEMTIEFMTSYFIDGTMTGLLKRPTELSIEDDIDDSGMEAIGRNKLSGKMDRASRKIYKGFRAYKDEEDKVDSQLSKLIKSLKDRANGNLTDEVIGGKEFSPIGVLKSILGTAAVFSFNKVAGVIYILTKYFYKKNAKIGERKRIIAMVEAELEILEEKIEDAKGDGNRQAKYAMMRTRGELQKFLNHLKHGLSADSNAIKAGKDLIRGKRSYSDSSLNKQSSKNDESESNEGWNLNAYRPNEVFI